MKKLRFKASFWLAFTSFMVFACIVTIFYLKPEWKFSNGKEWEDESEEEREREERGEKGFDKPDGFFDFYHLITTPIGKQSSGYPTNYVFTEFNKAKGKAHNLKSAGSTYFWVSRGPGNVGGRTRTVIVDPDDALNNTWFAAAVSGGVWKTINGGITWNCLTDDLPNLSANTMTMASSNHNIIYVGTGEGYGGYGMVGGNGIIVTKNKGLSWELIESTTTGENFKFVNKIYVDPADANILIVATNKGLFKSTDGGTSWNNVYSRGYAVQDVVANPKNKSILYAGVYGLGIIKSYNQGDSWVNAFDGIGEGRRFSLAISEADTNYLYTSVQTATETTEIYISNNGAVSWNKLNDYDNSFIDFFNGQGWFNNVIAVHPFESRKVYIGGVYLGLVEFKSTTSESDEQVMRVDTIGTTSFLGFINFGGSYFYGCLSTGLDEEAEVDKEDFVPVEIRFGPGISQKAHRFTVPEGEGPGVPEVDYSYQDYVDVPFQVWDTRNNQQLMVSFRDQERDGKFNLIERDVDDDISGREYIYVHSLPYNTTPDVNITRNGGHYYKMLYFFWPTLPEDKTWNESALPSSKIEVKYGRFGMQNATTRVLADKTRNKDLHVDHHDLKMIIKDAALKQFSILNANDGGLGISTDEGETWRQIKSGYITTQFYGVAKKAGSNEFIGGTQDNGTWKSPEGQNASVTAAYDFEIEGDGFEALWHPQYPQRIIGCSYNNYIKVSIDGGYTWKDATTGMQQGDGPFITRLSNSPDNPNVVFAVGNKGVYRHSNFCIGRFGWNLIDLGDGWTLNKTVTSSHNVEVSLADPNIVWAGGGMHEKPDLHVFLSKDMGLTFDTVPNYRGREMGFLTGIATHPRDTATAYMLFSLPYCPKILRTTDYGKTWEDISGFNQDSTSNNGFPDVMVYSLLVMPYNTNIIWAGTEIGIFESTDNGASWHYAGNGLPAVSIWQMFIQDNQLVVATHGRGIWSVDLGTVGLNQPSGTINDLFEVYPNPSEGMIHLNLNAGGSGAVFINVYDLKGAVVYSGQELLTNNRMEKILNLESLQSGTYIVRIEYNRKEYSKRIVIR